MNTAFAEEHHFFSILSIVHSGKLTWQWKMDPLKSFEDVFPIEHGDIPLLC